MQHSRQTSTVHEVATEEERRGRLEQAAQLSRDLADMARRDPEAWQVDRAAELVRRAMDSLRDYAARGES